MPTPEQQKIIKAEFGRIKGVTPDDARERAEKLQDEADNVSTRARAEAMRNKAEQLKEWAADFDSEADDEIASDKAESKARTETGSTATPARSSTGSKREPKKPVSRKRKLARKAARGRVGRSLKDATVGKPGRYVSGAIDSSASWFWLLVVSTLAAALVYRLVTAPTKTEALAKRLSTAVERAIYPMTAFPERYGNPGAQVQQMVSRVSGPTRKG